MKTCPFCAEEIQDAAIKCKHCGEMIAAATSLEPLQSESVSPATEEETRSFETLPSEQTYRGSRAPDAIPAALLLFGTATMMFVTGINYAWDSQFSGACVIVLSCVVFLVGVGGLATPTRFTCPLCRTENDIAEGAKPACLTCKLPLEAEWQGQTGKKIGTIRAPLDSLRAARKLGSVSPVKAPGCMAMTLFVVPVLLFGSWMLKPTPAPPPTPVAVAPEEPPPAVYLAQLATGDNNLTTGPEVARYQALLSRLKQKFPDQDEMRLAKVCVASWVMLCEKGHKDDLQAVMEAIDFAVPMSAAGTVKPEEIGGILVGLTKDKR